MNTIWKRFAAIASLVILILFILFVINQTAQVVGLAEKVNPSLGAVVLWGLLILYAVLIVIPISLFLRLPRSLKPPRSEDTPEFATYLETLKGRLASNPLLTGENLSNREDIEKALGLLERRPTRSFNGLLECFYHDRHLTERTARHLPRPVRPIPDGLADCATLLPETYPAGSPSALRQCGRYGICGRRAR